jgi:uroporphyrinogen decarboxylase
MDKRARLEATLNGEAADRTPVALWRSFPGDDQRPSDLAAAVVAFQKTYDWDYVVVSPAPTFAVTDYGVQDAWDGAADGARVISKLLISRSIDWTALRPLDPARGALGRQLEAIRLIREALGSDVPIVQVIPSPLTQAAMLSGRERLITHLRLSPDRLRSGLNVLTESLLRFMDALRRLGIDGILYQVSYADHLHMSEAEYAEFGMPDDHRLLTLLPPKWWLNGVHLNGMYPMFRTAGALPVQYLQWRDRTCDIDIASGKGQFARAVCGGLDHHAHLLLGTPGLIRQTAREAITLTGGRRFILSAGDAALISTPLSNLRAVREAVETT